MMYRTSGGVVDRGWAEPRRPGGSENWRGRRDRRTGSRSAERAAWRGIAWSLSLGLALLLSPAASDAANGEESAADGRRLYNAYCAVCHGDEGDGKGSLAAKLSRPPAVLDSPAYRDLDSAALARLISGYARQEGSGMPRWGAVLPGTDIEAIAAYVRVLGSDDLVYRGDTRRGRAVFQAMCAACHGRFGSGNGVLANVIGAPMVDFSDTGSLAALSDATLLDTIRDGRGEFMAPWRDVLGEQEIFDVAAYVRTLPALARATEGAGGRSPDPAAGGRMFRSYCVVCHGMDGMGNGPLASKLGFQAANLAASGYTDRTVDELSELISGYARPRMSNMPRWGAVLAPGEVADIASFIRAIGRSGARLPGDVQRGRALFKSVCVSCHGRRGDGDGVLAGLIGADVVDLNRSERVRALDDAALEAAIRDGKGAFMPAWRGVLNELEITDVASYVRLLSR